MLKSLVTCAILALGISASAARADILTILPGGQVTIGDDTVQCTGTPINDPCSTNNVTAAIALVNGCISAGYAATTCIQQTNSEAPTVVSCLQYVSQCTSICANAGYAYPTCEQTCAATGS